MWEREAQKREWGWGWSEGGVHVELGGLLVMDSQIEMARWKDPATCLSLSLRALRALRATVF